MSAISTILKALISVILAVSSLIAPSVTEDATKSNEPLNAEKIQLSFAAISDFHMRQETDDEFTYSTILANLILSDFDKAEVKPDALVVAGDITDHGEEAEWKQLQAHFEQYDIAKRILFANGNHDTWTEDSGKKTFKNLFIEYNEKIAGNKISKVYYSTKLNGYYFIFLGSEKEMTPAYFSQKQLTWLESEMKKAAKTNKPIFVISHWPLNKTHGLPVTWGDEEYTDLTGGIGEQSNKVKKILNKYENVFYITGHIHNGFSNEKTEKITGYQSIEKSGNITLVNLPSVSFGTKRGYMLPGTGYNVEVYKTKVIFRARNHATGCWLPDYDYRINLK